MNRFEKPYWLTFKNPYLFTIFSLGLFVGFWLGFFVFAQVHIRVVCQPSGRTLLDTRRNLRHEFVLSTGVSGCERIDLVVSKPKLTEIFSRGGREIIQEDPLELHTKETGKIPVQGGGEVQSGQYGGGITPTPPRVEESPDGIRIINLDVFGICSGKTTESAQYFDSLSTCLVKDILPYYVILEKSEDTIKTSFYEGIGFNETYNRTEYVGILRLFAKDLSAIDESINLIKAYGPMADYFELGDYVLEDITTLEGTERVVSFPLYVNENIPSTVDWNYLEFYIYMSQNIYYIGDIWIYVV
jgi:hypothetical protein